MKTSELSGAALDWAVAKCEGFTAYNSMTGEMLSLRNEYGLVQLCDYNYSADWAFGGPIIEREGLYLKANDSANEWACGALSIKRYDNKPGPLYFGPTPLVAAMRCYVASKLGDEIEIPEEVK